MYPLNYIEPVFRPPSEWKSLILQVTNGCSWNKCTFCEMYTTEAKRFKAKKLVDIEQEIITVAQSSLASPRIFLADGDAMMLPFRQLKSILLLIKQHLPSVTRVSSYCLPRNLGNKTVEQLKELQSLGLTLVYVGCESGDDQVLDFIEKGETFASSLTALNKLKASNIKSSVMILNGLGGAHYSAQHAIQSAKLMNAAQPNYLSTLVVSFPLGMERFTAGFNGNFKMLDQHQLFEEMHLLLTHLDLDKTIFRSDHASNYLALKGILGKDKAQMLSHVEQAMTKPNTVPLRQEWQRGL